MKSTISEAKPTPKIKYPCLMRGSDSGRVVLFTTHGVGTVVYTATGSGCYQIGHHQDVWAMEYFVPFTGSVALSND